MTTAKIPARLYAAYNWIDLLGEIPTLQSLSGDDLLAYCLDAASNAHAHGEPDVTESDVFALRVHLGGVWVAYDAAAVNHGYQVGFSDGYHRDPSVTAKDSPSFRHGYQAGYQDGAKSPRLNVGERAAAVKASVAKLLADAATSKPDGNGTVQL
jgi:hypothetical protein